MEVLEGEFREAFEAAQLGLFLINTLETHVDLQQARVAYIFRDEEITSGGRLVLGSAHLPRLQGSAAKHWGRFVEWSLFQLLGFEPTFVIFIDSHAWEGLDARGKLALVDHELHHCAQKYDADGSPKFNQVTGEPLWTIRPHDIEEFNEVIRQHGTWNEGLVETARAILDALNDGPKLRVPTEVREQEAR